MAKVASTIKATHTYEHSLLSSMPLMSMYHNALPGIVVPENVDIRITIHGIGGRYVLLLSQLKLNSFLNLEKWCGSHFTNMLLMVSHTRSLLQN
jgi:hypothetical protein